MNQYKITTLINKDNLRPEWVKDIPGTAQLDFVRDIARKCWTDDKTKRPSFNQICATISGMPKSGRNTGMGNYMSGGNDGSSGLSSGIEMHNRSKRRRTSQIFMAFAENFLVSEIKGKKKLLNKKNLYLEEFRLCSKKWIKKVCSFMIMILNRK